MLCVMLGAVARRVAEWLSGLLLPCFFKQVCGVSCPACGFQRAVLLLLQGEAWGAVAQFPPLAAWALSLTAWGTARLAGWGGKRLTRWLLWGNLAVMMANAVYQNVTG